MNHKEKLILSNERITAKIENRSFILDKSYEASRVLAFLALTANLTIFTASTGPELVNEIRNDIKPVGPYSLNDNLRFNVSNEPVPAYGSDAMRLSDDLDGLLGTSGYAVFIDAQQVLDELKTNEVLVVKQKDMTTDEDPTVSGSVYVAGDTDSYEEALKTVAKAGIAIPAFNSANGSAGGKGSLEEEAVGDYFVQINGGGTILHNNTPSQITVDKYRIEPDETVTAISHQKVYAEVSPNIKCVDVPEAISAEVVLTYDQYNIICQALKQYSQLLPNNYSVRLDAVDSKASMNDSLSYNSKTVQLTYPYVGKTEVETDEIRLTTLHEIFHGAYLEQIVNDPIFRLKLDTVYTAILNSTDFQIPSNDELRQGLTPTIPKVERVIGIITESEYMGPDSAVGHPWDNATEMLSSTVTVLAFYPDDFIKKYRHLNETQKHAIRDDVLAVVDLIKRYDVPVASIIPRYDLIAEELGL